MTTEEKTMTSECGCKMHYQDAGDCFDTRMEWCATHEAMADVLRRIMNDFDLLLAHTEKALIVNGNCVKRGKE